MFLKLGFFVLYICVLSQHTFVDGDSFAGNFFRRLGDWQHARAEAWNRKAHLWHFWDLSGVPGETPIGNLKHSLGNNSYKLAEKFDILAEKVRGALGFVFGGGLLNKKNSAGEKSAHQNPATSVSTSFTANVQPPSTGSTYNLRDVPFPPGYNPALPEVRSNPLPPGGRNPSPPGGSNPSPPGGSNPSPPGGSNPLPPGPNPITPTGIVFRQNSDPVSNFPTTGASGAQVWFFDGRGNYKDLNISQLITIGNFLEKSMKNDN